MVFLLVIVIVLCKRFKRKKVGDEKSHRESARAALGIGLSGWDEGRRMTEANKIIVV